MLVIVVATLTVVLMVPVVVVAALTVVMMVLVVVVAALTVVMMVLMVMMSFFFKMLKLGSQSRSVLHSLDDLCARKLIPRSRHDDCIGIMLSDQSDAFAYFRIGNFVGVAENDTRGIFYLIIEEFTEVLHMHLALVGIYNSRSSVKLCTVSICIFYCRYDVG